VLPTFVIGLREGLEAALIVGIIAAFLGNQGRRDLLRWVLGGVVIAVLICFAAGEALHYASKELPQKQQEGLETVIGAVAVGMVTYMVVWMKRHSRDLKGQLEGLAAEAMAGRGNAGRAMVLMAFLAVFREGLETVVFAIAIFDQKTVDTSSAAWGLFLGLACATVLGYAIYRGGVRINLSKFFRVTGLVLVLVAAGLVVNALHTAHEAGWLNAGQGRTVDLSWLVSPGSVRESLLTGMLGLQAHPVTIEVVGWLVYLIPVALYVSWPSGRRAPLRGTVVTGAAVAVGGAVAALLCALLAPSAPTDRPTLQAQTTQGAVTARVEARGGDTATISATALDPIGAGHVDAVGRYGLTSQGIESHAGRALERYISAPRASAVTTRPATLSLAQAAALNGGRLPIGMQTTGFTSVGASYTQKTVLTAWLDTRTARIVDLRWRATVSATLRQGSQVFPLDTPVASGSVSLPAATRTAAAAAVGDAHSDLDSRSALHAAAAWLVALAIAGVLALLASLVALRRRARPARAPAPAQPLVTVKR